MRGFSWGGGALNQSDTPRAEEKENKCGHQQINEVDQGNNVRRNRLIIDVTGERPGKRGSRETRTMVDPAGFSAAGWVGG